MSQAAQRFGGEVAHGELGAVEHRRLRFLVVQAALQHVAVLVEVHVFLTIRLPMVFRVAVSPARVDTLGRRRLGSLSRREAPRI